MFSSRGKMDESSIIPVWKVIGAEEKEIQGLLKAVVQSVGWTYSLFWQLCPQRRFSFHFIHLSQYIKQYINLSLLIITSRSD